MNILKGLRGIILTAALVIIATNCAHAQTIEKLDLVLGPPALNTDPGNGYQFEMRGNLYPGNTPFACDLVQSANRVGRYLLKVRYNKADGLIATWVITLNDGRVILWDALTFYQIAEGSKEPITFSYEAVILRSSQTAVTDFQPLSPDCFGGKLVIFFLNGG